MNRPVQILLLSLLTVGCGQKAPTPSVLPPAGTQLDLSGVYTLDYKRSQGTVGCNRPFLNKSDVAPYTPIQVLQPSSNIINIVFSRWSGNTHTNTLNVGLTPEGWRWEKAALVYRGMTSVNGLPAIGSAKQELHYSVSKSLDGDLLIHSSMAERGRLLWVVPWKDSPITRLMVLKSVTNLTELAQARERWKNHNK